MSTVPIVPGFFPDPSICRVGDRYYLVNSTFEYLPGVPVHVSDDLVTWEQVGSVYARREQLDLRNAPSNAGVYAPTIRHHGGRFYVVTTDLGTAGQGQLIASATDVAGEWTIPVRVPDAIGIDPDLYWDEDDMCWLTWRRGLGGGDPGICSVPVDPDTGATLGPVVRVWQGIPGLADPEGPHLYRRDGYLYCLLAQGGTNHGHSVVIARARSIDGPWEANPANPVLSHRSTDLPVQNTGHGDLVELADGAWAMVHLGVRPRGMVPGFTTNGRETFLVGIDWVEGWPVVDEDAFMVPPASTGFIDEFDAGELHPRWISHGGVQWDAVSLGAGAGVTIRATIDAARADEGARPALGVRARDAAWRAEALVSPDGNAALQLRMDSDNWVEVRHHDDTVTAVQRITGVARTIGTLSPTAPVTGLIIESTPWPAHRALGAGPDVVVLSALTDAGPEEVARTDGRLLSAELSAGFTGRTIGLRALDAPVTVTRFAYAPNA